MADVWTIGKLLAWTADYFKGKGMDAPRLDAEVLLAHLMERDRMYLYVHFDEPLEETELAAYRELVRRRAAHEPVAYITGVKEFMGYDFRVTRATLIPRPDTETLVEAALDGLERLRKLRGESSGARDAAGSETRAERGDALRIADIGAGTGAIALSVLAETADAARCGQIEARLIDISAEALAVAEENARLLGVRERADFCVGDLLSPLEGGAYDAILSNPPYIRADEMASLAPDVRDYEPHTALTDGGDGLSFYRRLIAEARDHLKDTGFLAVECGLGESDAIAAMAESAGWREIETKRDLAGIDRVVTLWK